MKAFGPSKVRKVAIKAIFGRKVNKMMSWEAKLRGIVNRLLRVHLFTCQLVRLVLFNDWSDERNAVKVSAFVYCLFITWFGIDSLKQPAACEKFVSVDRMQI